MAETQSPEQLADAVPPLPNVRVSDAPATTSSVSPVPQSPRIRRGFACVACRDAKVKCSTSQTPNRPCLRCAKLELQCVVDKSHKRTSRRSKLEELAAEVRNIKEAVAPRPFVETLPEPAPSRPVPVPVQLPLPSPRSNSQSLQEPFAPATSQQFFDRSRSFMTAPSPALTASLGLVDGVPASDKTPEPRALGSRVFSGEDIGYYFKMYFDHFHAYLPIIRTRDPDNCYQRGPVLFWAIILTACRRYARDDSVYQFLVDSLLPQIWNSVAQPPLRLCSINAVLLLATWPFPNVRFLSDPSLIFVGIAMNSSFLIGLHTGRGSHAEFHGPLYKMDTTDEEATYTWAGCNIISHRVAAYMGCPSTNSLFNQTIDKLLDGTAPFLIPRYFAIHLETARFSNRVSKTMSASLEEAQGVSHHMVIHLEEEYAKVQRLLYPDNSDLDNFTLLSTLLEIQIYYFMPLPGYSEGTLKRNVLKCYTTAETLINLSLKLHREIAFLHYAPHYVYRTLLSSACVIIIVHFSAYTKGFQQDSVDTLIKDVIRAMRICSVQEGDLHRRGANMLEKYWNIRQHLPRIDVADLGISVYTHRLGASLAFDCLRRWKRNLIENVRVDSENPPAPGCDQPQEGPALGRNNELGLVDPFQRIDWNTFMDDFDWSFTSNYNYLSAG